MLRSDVNLPLKCTCDAWSAGICAKCCFGILVSADDVVQLFVPNFVLASWFLRMMLCSAVMR